jgi:hypothetical protein
VAARGLDLESDTMLHENFMLIHTGARDANGTLVREFKVRALEAWEKNVMNGLGVEEALADVKYIRF